MKYRKRSNRMYLEDMILAMSRVAEYMEGLSFTEFEKDPKTVDAVIRNFEVLGEASKNLPEDIKTKLSKLLYLNIRSSQS